MHILVFPGWYPGKVDKLAGDFIQRHMHAIAQNCEVSVVFAVKDHSIKKMDVVTVKKGTLTEIVYYYPSLISIKWLDNFLSFIRYNYYCIKTAKALHQHRKVDIVQLYVLQKNQLIGIILKLLYRIPYVVSEQSTVYVDGRFDKMNLFSKMALRWVFNYSHSYHAVSNYLMQALKTKLKLKKDGVVIPNVVDLNLFFSIMT